MVTQADIPPDVSDDVKASIFKILDVELNSRVLYALLHGIYTGILAVTLWNIFVNKCSSSRRVLVVLIILLYALISVNFAATWSFICSSYIENGHNFWAVYLKLTNSNRAISWETGIPALISTVLADSYIIWCCWMVWGQRWLIVLFPILTLISAIVSKSIQTYHENSAATDSFVTLYLSSVLATTLWCTLFIILRILTVTGVRRGAGDRLRVYRRVIEVLVESSALYSMGLILDLALFIRDDYTLFYFDVIAGIAKGVAPTLLVGRAAAGHTRPTEERDESSTVSTLRFQMLSQSSPPSQLAITSSFQESTMQSAVNEIDIEAQTERSDDLVLTVSNMQ